MNLWYEQSTTIQSFNARGCFDDVLRYAFDNIKEMDRDFEVKRLVMGLSSLLCEPNQSDPCVTSKTSEFVNAIMFLCQKSFEIRDKKSKHEEAEVDDSGEKDVIYDDEGDEAGNFLDDGEDIGDSDEDYDPDDDEEASNELYECKLDSIDEVLFFKEKLDIVQNMNPNQFNQIISCLD